MSFTDCLSVHPTLSWQSHPVWCWQLFFFCWYLFFSSFWPFFVFCTLDLCPSSCTLISTRTSDQKYQLIFHVFPLKSYAFSLLPLQSCYVFLFYPLSLIDTHAPDTVHFLPDHLWAPWCTLFTEKFSGCLVQSCFAHLLSKEQIFSEKSSWIHFC